MFLEERDEWWGTSCEHFVMALDGKHVLSFVPREAKKLMITYTYEKGAMRGAAPETVVYLVETGRGGHIFEVGLSDDKKWVIEISLGEALKRLLDGGVSVTLAGDAWAKAHGHLIRRV